MLSGACMFCISEVLMAAIFNGCSCGIKNYDFRVIFNGMTSTEFHKNLAIGSEVDMGVQTHRQDGNLISLHFSFRRK
jgi:hypothetical protein